jgi:hypothetical protein
MRSTFQRTVALSGLVRDCQRLGFPRLSRCSMALTQPKAPYPRLARPGLCLIGLRLLSLGLFIPRFCMSPCSPAYVITPVGCRALVGGLLVGILTTYALEVRVYTVHHSTRFLRRCLFFEKGFHRFTRFASGAYAASGSKSFKAKVLPAKIVPPVVVSLMTIMLLILHVVVANEIELAKVA